MGSNAVACNGNASGSCMSWTPSENCEKKNLVLDLGGVLMKWNGADLGGFVAPKLFAHMVQDSIWNQYETGKLSSDQAFHQLSQRFGVPAGNIKSAVEYARDGLVPIPVMVRIVAECHGKLRLFCMSNIPAQEFDYLYKKYPEVFQNFERIFTSADVELRKPQLSFFRYVLQEAGINPTETVFVDDTLENCVAARSLGITAVFLEEVDSAVQQLAFTLRTEEDRLAGARMYLDEVVTKERHELRTLSDKGEKLSDNWSEFFIAELLEDSRFLPMNCAPENGEICYTRDTATKHTWVLHSLPTDLDTTSIGISVLYAHGKVDLQFINLVADKMLNFVSEDGIFQTYFDHARIRIDPVVVANITFLFHLAGRSPPIGTLEFLYNCLLNRAYLDGSQYYLGRVAFLFFLSRIAAKFRDNHFLPIDFVPLLTQRVHELMRTGSDHIHTAQIVLACLNLGIKPDPHDVEKLARSQNPDGSWDLAYILRGSARLFGNKPLATAFALAALERSRV